MKAYYPINLPEWLGSEACCVISEKGSTEFSIPCMTGHTRLQKAGGMQKCTLPNIKSHDVTPLYCYGNEVKKTVAILWYKTLKWRLYCCTKQRTVERSRLIILSLRRPFWCTPQKKILRRFRPKLGNPGYFCSESGSWALESGLQFKASGIAPAIGIWNPSPRDRESGIN